jgi:hypothetical protein
MSDINQIVSSTITRTSAAATLPGFGVPAVFNQFAAGTKGFAASGVGSRTRPYYDTASMLTDGWAATDSVYLWASAVFAQNPKVPKILVGRIDSGDASVAASGDAIRAENDDFYCFEVVGNRSLKFTLSTALTTGNVVKSTINGIAVADVTYATSHANTMSLWKTAIESAITGATATVSGNDMTVVLVGKDMNIATFLVTGGTAVTATLSYPLEATKTKAWMAWTEQQKKLYFFQESDAAAYAADTTNTGTAGLTEYARLMNYERTVSVWHANSSEYLAASWIGDQLPYDPGRNTWAFKTMAGVSTSSLTTTQETYIRGKGGNVYTLTAGVASTFAGTCAKAQRYIDDQRFLDWQDTQIKLDFANLQFQAGKIPFTDTGIQMVQLMVQACLEKGVKAGGWAPGSIVVTVPKAKDISGTNKANRNLPDVKWSATLSGAVHTVQVTGTVSV